MICSICKSRLAEKYPISEKEVRILCQVCVTKSLNRDRKERVNYVKASELYHGLS